MTASQLLYDPVRAGRLPQVDGILVTDIAWDRPSPVRLTSPRVWFLSQAVVMQDSFAMPPEPVSLVYLTRVQGITGADQRASGTTAEAVRRVRERTGAGLWLGFGASTREDIQAAAGDGADGVVIGSAFVAEMSRRGGAISAEAPAGERVRVLSEAAGEWVDRLVRE